MKAKESFVQRPVVMGFCSLKTDRLSFVPDTRKSGGSEKQLWTRGVCEQKISQKCYQGEEELLFNFRGILLKAGQGEDSNWWMVSGKGSNKAWGILAKLTQNSC